MGEVIPPPNYMEVQTSLDWNHVKDEIRKMSKMLPAFSHDFYRVTIHLESLVKNLANSEIEYRRTKSRHYKELCKKQAKQINEELNQIKKIHLMSVLSR